jgi:shikimate 5-dehydrogenase
VAGFLAPLGDLDLAGMRAAVVGAGGAARAVVSGLRARGASVVVHARDRGRAEAVAGADAAVRARIGVPEAGSWDLLVNATPVGTYPDVDATPVPATELTGGLVYDLVYNPVRTRLLREAEAAGCRTIGGLEMLVAQAALQFEWWTGVRAPVNVMREAAEARLATMTGAQ